MVDFEYAHPWGAEKPKEVKCISWLNVAGISYRITGDGIEIKAELRLEAQVITQNSLKIISEIRADEDRPRARDTSAALSIYYADPGESLWDIARAYLYLCGRHPAGEQSHRGVRGEQGDAADPHVTAGFRNGAHPQILCLRGR